MFETNLVPFQKKIMGCVYAQWLTWDTKSRTQACQVYVANESSCWRVRVLTCMGTFTCVWWSNSWYL